MTNPPNLTDNDWQRRLDPKTDTSMLLETLQTLASEENVAGVAGPCLKLLAHDDSQVRVWAAEALESAAAPADDETETISDWLGKLLDQQSVVAKKQFVWPGAETTSATTPKTPGVSQSQDPEMADSMLADQLYWAATMIGRIGKGAAAADPMLARLESLGENPSDKPFHDAASRAARMRKRILS